MAEVGAELSQEKTIEIQSREISVQITKNREEEEVLEEVMGEVLIIIVMMRLMIEIMTQMVEEEVGVTMIGVASEEKMERSDNSVVEVEDEIIN